MKFLAQILGWTFLLLGGLCCGYFGLGFLFVCLLGPAGIILAIYFALPGFLVGLTVLSLGRFLKNHADRMPSLDRPIPYPPAYLVNRASSQMSAKKGLS
jgi:hypothetical protein